MRVAVLSRDTPDLVGLRGELHAMGQPSLVFAGDVSDPETVARAAAEIEARLGPVEVLVNNAAVVGPARFLEDADLQAWRRTVDVNLTGAYLCARAFLPGMVQRRRGRVVNLSSGLGQMGFPRFCAYAVSKAGIIQLTRSLAEELREHGVRVNAVDPGVMDTPMQAEIRALGPAVLGEEVHRDFVGFRERGELKDPGEVARLIAWLCSPVSDPITGVNGTLCAYRELGWE
jgi:NAD(P)-dependent dehydrogenase (short-subunit alcohol dehydrogenase family)